MNPMSERISCVQQTGANPASPQLSFHKLIFKKNHNPKNLLLQESSSFKKANKLVKPCKQLSILVIHL